MFSPEQRAELRSELLDYGRGDRRISGAAITGSAAAGREDRWSDIDLAFGVGDADELQGVLADWTVHMYDRHQALHHVDIKFGAWIYRVFLLPSTLQVDLAFVPASEFRPLAPTFRLVFGKSNDTAAVPASKAGNVTGDTIGFGWLYAVHARSCIARGKVWQAEYMISSIRDNALALACIRHGLPAVHGRGIDQLPGEVTSLFEGSLVRQLEISELSRALGVAIDGLLREIEGIDKEIAARLRETLLDLNDSGRS